MTLDQISSELDLLREYRDVLRTIYNRGSVFKKDLCVIMLLKKCNDRIVFLEGIRENNEADDSYNQNTGVYRE